MEKIIVVIVILVLVFVIYFLCVGGKRGNTEESGTDKQSSRPASPAPAQQTRPQFEDIGTRLVSKLCIEQLDRTGRVVKTFDIDEIPDVGVTISRPGAKQGDVILSELSGEDAMTVGTEGIVIAEDEKGIFGKIFDNGREKNKVYLFDPVTNKSREVTQFDIANNTMVCVGRQWLRFILPTAPGVPMPAGGMAVNAASQRSSAPARQGVVRQPQQQSYAPQAQAAPRAYASQAQPSPQSSPRQAQPAAQPFARPQAQPAAQPFARPQAQPAAKPYGQQTQAAAQPFAKQAQPAQPAPQPDAPQATKPVAPSGFSFESSMDDKGRFVITKK